MSRSRNTIPPKPAREVYLDILKSDAAKVLDGAALEEWCAKLDAQDTESLRLLCYEHPENRK